MTPNERSQLEELADALAALYDVYTPEGVGMWLRGGKHSFGGRSPLQVIREGDVRGFVARVEQLRSGVMVEGTRT